MTSLLVTPTYDMLPDYTAALQRGWSPDNLRPEAAEEQLREIDQDPHAFLAKFDDRDAKGPPVTLPDGSIVPRLPSLRRWIWRDGFCGSIGLRWQPGTDDLPPTCLGHAGYAIVPWRRREGLASAALIELLPIARGIGLNHLDITTDADNLASQGVVQKAGGVFVKTFTTPPELGGYLDHLYRINLTSENRQSAAEDV